jgi:hypothetical protein
LTYSVTMRSVTPHEPFKLSAMANSRRGVQPWIVAVVAVFALLLGAGGAWYFTGRPEPRSIDGVEAPNELCRSDIEDLDHPWIRDGWWVGYVDGKVKEMQSSDAQALSMAGFKMSGIWLCPPKRDW